jgi:hypothetical protein
VPSTPASVSVENNTVRATFEAEDKFGFVHGLANDCFSTFAYDWFFNLLEGRTVFLVGLSAGRDGYAHRTEALERGYSRPRLATLCYGCSAAAKR